MAIKLGDHFTYKRLLKAVMPSIFMMLFTSVYSIVDGIFVSNFVGKIPFAGINLIMPVIMILGAVGFMIGTGGSALVAKLLGEGNQERANQVFSMLLTFTIISGIVLSAITFIFIEPLALLLGATAELLPHCIVYGRILIATNVIYMVQCFFQNLFVVAEKPILGFLVIVAAGVTNIVLDALFVAVFKWGLVGAATATSISYIVGGVIPIFYFCKKNSSILKLVKAKLSFKPILQSCLNGSSELLTNISASIISIVFNLQLLKFAGENGVAAYGVIMYATFIFAAIFLGYSIGVAPIVAFQYGARNHKELNNLLKKSLVIVAIFGIVITLLTEVFAYPLSYIFVGYDKELLSLTTKGMMLFSTSFLIFGLNIFASSFFTSLNNGLVSAIISFARTLLFQLLAIIILPFIFKLNGIWLSVTIGEILALIVSIVCLVANKKKYNY